MTKNLEALNLLKTARGQIDGVIKMIEDERYCIDISKQLLSLISLLRKSNGLILKNHMETCVREAIATEDIENKMKELEEILSYLV
ncbi:MAG TPA: metal-sensing transcriptional repressor [bacterium]|nr:metal-sensing transcriptional repressor [Dictyoglomota bacterium]HHV81792.1 metal-sensing transcriptional repressor [bacterium]HOK29127.1 metal-sensing transcriptional repressor [bacterium]HOL54388.1 metal-sensing transcriptional repressor [bacterium]HON72561.1 metal-sensing transcriptional repressor [bacterium]